MGKTLDAPVGAEGKNSDGYSTSSLYHSLVMYSPPAGTVGPAAVRFLSPRNFISRGPRILLKSTEVNSVDFKVLPNGQNA